jgi:hypothetical protein
MKTFFGMLLGDTTQGFFADPMYGGNRDKIGWKTIGFPGVGAVYYAAIDKRNTPYVVAPVGIADEMKSQMAILRHAGRARSDARRGTRAVAERHGVRWPRSSRSTRSSSASDGRAASSRRS